MEKSEEPDSPKDIFTENHLVGVCLDLFEAGGETVGSTLSWVLLYLSLQQKEQTKCQKEISWSFVRRQIASSKSTSKNSSEILSNQNKHF